MIDTLSKRISNLKMTLPVPDGTLDAGDREHITWNYTGIAASPPIAVAPVWIFIAATRPFVFPATERGNT